MPLAVYAPEVPFCAGSGVSRSWDTLTMGRPISVALAFLSALVLLGCDPATSGLRGRVVGTATNSRVCIALSHGDTVVGAGHAPLPTPCGPVQGAPLAPLKSGECVAAVMVRFPSSTMASPTEVLWHSVKPSSNC